MLDSDVQIPDRMDWAPRISLWRKSRTYIGRWKERLNLCSCKPASWTQFTKKHRLIFPISVWDSAAPTVRVIGCFTWIDTSGHKTWPQYKQYLELGKQKPQTWIESSCWLRMGRELEGSWFLVSAQQLWVVWRAWVPNRRGTRGILII